MALVETCTKYATPLQKKRQIEANVVSRIRENVHRETESHLELVARGTTATV